jgi:hypothetical protein
MRTQTAPKPKASRPSRTLRLYPGSPALLEMTIGRDTFSYWLQPLPADAGSAFELPLSTGRDAHPPLWRIPR